MSNKFEEMLVDFGAKICGERDAAHDLWTWLPSYTVAKKHHEDYVDEFTPSVRDVMLEASSYLARLRGYPESPADQETFMRCPCGETHDEA